MRHVRVSLKTTAAAVLAILVISACAGGDSVALILCKPFDTQSSAAVQLGDLLGAGRGADGTIYVVDQVGSDFRVFISEGDALQRRKVDGSGESTTADGRSVALTVSMLDLVVQVAVDGSGNVRMGILHGATGKPDFEIGMQGEELEILQKSVIQDIPLRNLPGDVTIEYWATTADGRLLLVTRPTNDWTYMDFRLFLGTSERVEEYEVTEVIRARDGGTTTITFLEETNASAYFPAPSLAANAVLTENGSKQDLTMLSTSPDASGAEFYCRK